ncbi:hypothetical protein [Anthocerotibacter panamensis]|uniref:hypothetical protein n=1 Tax=Anthocerotibacter panamensis TaxID=2857077 RepID=UPI001C4058C6|nr:hypothetical protein [Anthocerotibacter panamensis]
MSKEPYNLALVKFVRRLPPAVRQQHWRRGIIVGMYGAYLGALLSPWYWASFLLGCVCVCCLLVLMGATGAVADLANSYIDERERSVRDHAYRWAYISLATLILLAALYLSFTLKGKFGLPLPTVDWIDALLNSAVFLPLSLPTVIVGWNEPDEEDSAAPIPQ